MESEKKIGHIGIRLQAGQDIDVPVSSAEEFAALAMILDKSPVAFDTVSGDILTGRETVGGN